MVTSAIVNGKALPRSIPHDFAAERHVLGAILCDSTALDRITDTLPEHFLDRQNRTVFRIMKELRKDGALPTVDLIYERAVSSGRLDEIGGEDHLTDLCEAVPYSAQIKGYADLIKSLWQRAELKRQAERFIEAVDNPSVDVGDLLLYADNITAGIDSQKPIDDLVGFRAPEWESQIRDTTWLIPDWIPADEYGILGAPPKSMKTRIMVMICAALATCDPFMGREEWRPAKPVRSHLLAGETTYRSALATLRRIAYAANRSIADYALFSMVKRTLNLGSAHDIDRIKSLVDRDKIEFLGIDPFYLFCPGLGTGMNSMGAVADYLGGLTEVHQATGVAILVSHHFPKSATRIPGTSVQGYGMPDLSWLAGAGCDAWARYYLLVNRREKFDPDHKGFHKLWLTLGGESVEPQGLAVDIDEAKELGHTWTVTVSPASEFIAQEQVDDVQSKEAAKEEKRQAVRKVHREQILKAFGRFPKGESKSTIRETAGLRTDYFTPILMDLLDEGKVEVCKFKKGKRQVDGYRLSRELGNE